MKGVLIFIVLIKSKSKILLIKESQAKLILLLIVLFAINILIIRALANVCLVFLLVRLAVQAPHVIIVMDFLLFLLGIALVLVGVDMLMILIHYRVLQRQTLLQLSVQ